MVQSTRGAEEWTYEPVSLVDRPCVVEIRRLGRGYRWRPVLRGHVKRVQFQGYNGGPCLTIVDDSGSRATLDPTRPEAQYAGVPCAWRLRFLPTKAT